MADAQRTVLKVTVLVESRGTPEEHNRTVLWVANQLKDSARFIRNGFAAIEVVNETDGVRLGFSGNGAEISKETEDIITELFDAS